MVRFEATMVRFARCMVRFEATMVRFARCMVRFEATMVRFRTMHGAFRSGDGAISHWAYPDFVDRLLVVSGDAA
jgi:hypothetical protein